MNSLEEIPKSADDRCVNGLNSMYVVSFLGRKIIKFTVKV